MMVTSSSTGGRTCDRVAAGRPGGRACCDNKVTNAAKGFGNVSCS
jgi:hypothetical protein